MQNSEEIALVADAWWYDSLLFGRFLRAILLFELSPTELWATAAVAFIL